MPVDPSYNARCRRCGIDLSLVDRLGAECLDVAFCTARVAKLPSPFDPTPRALEAATNGFVWCDRCHQVRPAAGHHCSLFDLGPPIILDVMAIERRAELAESLVGALALEHGLDHMGTFDLDDVEIAAATARGGWVWALCDIGTCVFCDAARGGGR